jgi:hypothetical protein
VNGLHPRSVAPGVGVSEPSHWLRGVAGYGLVFSAVCLVLAVGLRPVADPGVWWDLSRALVVLDGSCFPARELCAGPVVAEADWLAGVPWYFVFLAGGPAAFTLVRVVALVLVARWGWKHGGSPPERALLMACAVLGMAPALQPGDRWADALAGLALPLLWASGTNVRTLVGVFVASVLWGNCGPRSVLLLAAIPFLAWHGRSVRFAVVCGVVALAGLSLTPRGPMGVWDSLRIVAPWLCLTPGELLASEWPPIWGTHEWGAVLGWGVLSLLVVVRRSRLADPGLAAWGLLQTAVVWNASLVPVLLPWLWRLSPPVTESVQSGPVGFGARPVASFAVTLLLLIGSVGFASGSWPGDRSRLGWGVVESLDPRPLADVIPRSASGTVFAPDVRTAGLVTWVAPRSLKPWLTPRQALLTGHWRGERDLASELREGWEQWHPRRDGTPGGWWIPLRARETVLVMVPAEDESTIRSFEPGLWKPLAVDTPVLAYAFSGTPWSSEGIVRTAGQRDFAERGGWVYQPPSPWGNDWSVDLWGGIITGRPDPALVQRQVRVFQAMGLPTAAVRMIHGWRATYPGELRVELAEAQIELAVVERRWTGRELVFRPDAHRALRTVSGPDRSETPHAVRLYVMQGPLAVARDWPPNDPWRHFWRARMFAEVGDITLEREALLELQRSDDFRAQGVARDLLRRLPSSAVAGGGPL